MNELTAMTIAARNNTKSPFSPVQSRVLPTREKLFAASGCVNIIIIEVQVNEKAVQLIRALYSRDVHFLCDQDREAFCLIKYSPLVINELLRS